MLGNRSLHRTQEARSRERSARICVDEHNGRSNASVQRGKKQDFGLNMSVLKTLPFRANAAKDERRAVLLRRREKGEDATSGIDSSIWIEKNQKQMRALETKYRKFVPSHGSLESDGAKRWLLNARRTKKFIQLCRQYLQSNFLGTGSWGGRAYALTLQEHRTTSIYYGTCIPQLKADR